ncbi:MAG: hypothetical protein DCC88_07705 [Spirobacillus cienkowskii]|uniref:Uncharacterized protein n=1 Tax=Spirobacillus cienkowskii TaxID=495820 RepID=A0A369KT92_9BACT|nr:MAG: hypothetical protein DCC88_07705 [Spirobacillus cienkowskii]
MICRSCFRFFCFFLTCRLVFFFLFIFCLLFFFMFWFRHCCRSCSRFCLCCCSCSICNRNRSVFSKYR